MRIINGTPDFVYRMLLRDISSANLHIKITLDEFMVLCKRSGSVWLLGNKYEPNVTENV